ncbi:MAG: aldehyde dehydrogenase family protein [Porticoccaceae bacterium]|jgi:aldehyde dehydrogenase (NAD+)|nr:aldehyde dehydrogenase family protein [Porticoccaceae bacterium]MBT3798687.1 aldehyde dehydrogenase family protein [Porticoccaceae bacterium]MBT4163725.1 aldehyde dehydrogenase family protein [Porticoccaceae bacterium]MBT4590607.1 aldehyde dehydrogenase family protein [Porticoccaceae bacterium]MBT5003527.1 aldehyde dehydrogenase family protein [Porticoccaceae bacterium]|tara:strand:- start:668 stop:2086 length:1419 start_codon:yes stop_codon:yes gene_type:complete
MKDLRKFYINGEWVDPTHSNDLQVENPANEEMVATISLGGETDVNLAVAAAKRAFASYSQISVEERIALMEKLLQIYMDRYDEMSVAISVEMGAPISFATAAQADCGRGHINAALEALKQFEFERQVGTTRIVKEPIGVCGFITPWNWPINQISCKVAPALATGCTMVLKPSEIAPISGYLFTEIMHQAGFPAGVYNMVNGDGPNVGAVIAGHPDVDMVSFTGSTRAGILVAQAAAPTVKRVTQELGGKSPNIIFEDADLESAVSGGIINMMSNTGQSCNAPSRMLVQSSVYDRAVEIAKQAAENVAVDEPTSQGWHIGPLSSRVQFEKVQGLIEKGISEGAKLVTGGLGKPEGFDAGYFVKPTVFAGVNNQMTIAQEEIFGPVLTMIPFDTEEQAIEIANDTPYGLAAYFSTSSEERARRVAGQLRAGMVSVNSASQDYAAPFGGYKQSGNGREWGEFGFDDYLEIKGITS